MSTDGSHQAVFQARGPATAKARSPSVERHIAGTVKSAEEAGRRRRRGSMLSTGQMTSCRYLGTVPCTQLKTSTQSVLVQVFFSFSFTCASFFLVQVLWVPVILLYFIANGGQTP